MNPVLRNLLSDRNWLVRKRTDKGWIRDDLGAFGQQNAEGRLEVRLPADASSPMQLISKRPISGDFVCRLIVTSSDKRATVGLFASGIEDEGFAVPLPKETTLVELSRKQGKLSCTLNGSEAELIATGKPAARLSGYVGLQIAPGGEIVVAAVEFAAR
jgi:hypothetical protein